jgi:hypothetical protein
MLLREPLQGREAAAAATCCCCCRGATWIWHLVTILWLGMPIGQPILLLLLVVNLQLLVNRGQHHVDQRYIPGGLPWQYLPSAAQARPCVQP